MLLSRAKHGMYILGNDETLYKAAQLPPQGSNRSAAPMWGNVLDELQGKEQIGPELEVSLPSSLCSISRCKHNWYAALG